MPTSQYVTMRTPRRHDGTSTRVGRTSGNKASQRVQGRRREGGGTDSQSYLDDTNLITPHQDLEFSLDYIAEHGPGTGVVLSTTKNQIITSLTGEDPRDHSAKFRAHEKSITRVIAKYGSKKGELRNGGILLGQPIGPRSLVESTTKKTIVQIRELTKYLQHIDYDPHVAFRLFRMTIMQKATHLFAADTLSQTIPENNWPDTR